MRTTKEIIQKYYNCFNERDISKFMDLLHEEIIHDINQGEREIGKEKFLTFMKQMTNCYQEKIKNILIMTNEDGQHAAAEFVIDGVYLATDSNLPVSHGQTYSLAGGAFFEITDNKISRVTNYYNIKAWLKQVGS